VTTAIETLPDDIETLKRLVLERDEQLERVRDAARVELDRRDAEALHLRTWVEKLKLEIARLKRMQFGRSSERLAERIDQLELIVEDLQTSQAQTASGKAIAADKVQPVRKPLPEHLPRETVTHEPASNCPDCGGAMKRIGDGRRRDCSTYVPARLQR